MIKITFNPLKLIKLTSLVLSIGFVLTLDVSWFWTFDANKEATYEVEILEKRGSEVDRTFTAKEVESGRIFTIHPTQSWFNEAKVGDINYTNISPTDFNPWIAVWIMMSWISIIISAIIIISYSISWIGSNYYKLDRDVDLYIGESSWHSPISIKKVELHEVNSR